MSYYPNDQRAYGRQRQQRRRSNFSGLKLRLLIGGAIVLFSVVSYLTKGQINPVTGQKQRVNLSIQDEIAMGFQSVSRMGQQSLNMRAQHHVDQIGNQLIRSLESKLAQEGIQIPYPFEFHLLADDGSVNAFALPGGQVFITETLYRLLSSDGATAHDARLAGVLGHEIGHVLERHSSEQMATGGLLKGIAGAAGVAGGDANSSRAASWLGNIFSMKYGRQDELESDLWGVELMLLANYDPHELIAVMDVLEASAGGGGSPEFLSTHPRPANRKKYIEDIIKEKSLENPAFAFE